MRGRGWILVLAAMAVLTAACVAGYVAAPFESQPAARSGATGPHVVDPEHRIVAVTTDGALVILDARDGALSETVVPSGFDDASVVDTGGGNETAYVGRDDATITLVRLRTGEDEARATGRAPAVGPLAFPQLDPVIDRPEVDQMAAVIRRDGVDHLTVENLVTGSRTVIGPRDENPAFRSIERLTWGTSGNRLFGIADRGRLLFRITTDRALTLDAAAVSEPLPAGSRWIDLASTGTGLVGILETGGHTELVEIDGQHLQRGDVLHRSDPSTTLTAIDADPSMGQFIVTTRSGDLLRFVPGSGQAPTVLATGITSAAW